MEATEAVIRDYTIRKPPSVELYAVHRFVAELCGGDPYLYVDRGDHVVVRTPREICERVSAVPAPDTGEVVAFTLRAAVSKRVRGRNQYAALGDWRARHEWLNKRSEANGFSVLALHVTSRSVRVEGRDGRSFYMDQSDFTGVLKVRDRQMFSACLARGIGRVGKPYGMGMLVI
jgi:hypothetical protein